jgi:hypothetical protein
MTAVNWMPKKYYIWKNSNPITYNVKPTLAGSINVSCTLSQHYSKINNPNISKVLKLMTK